MAGAIEAVNQSKDGFVWARVSSTTFYSCYFSPNRTLAEYQTYMADLEEDLKRKTGPVIVEGDFNAKPAAWGSNVTDRRGLMLEDIMTELDLQIANIGDQWV